MPESSIENTRIPQFNRDGTFVALNVNLLPGKRQGEAGG